MHVLKRRRTSSLVFAAAFLLAATTIACGGSEESAGAEGSPAAENVTLRLGYFPNITHAQALVGLERGTYAEELGANVKLETKTFNAGPAAIEALFAGAIDATYIGPNPAINGYVQSDGKELRIVAGATSGGALLIVRPEAGINAAADFANKKVATPQLGNTQDVARSTPPGCPSPGARASSRRRAADFSSTSATSGPTATSSRRTSSSARSS